MRWTLLAGCGVLMAAPSWTVAQVPAPGPFPNTFMPPPPPLTLVERNRNLIPVLLESLKDKDEVVRRNATEALRGLGSDAIPVLIEVLRGKDNSLRPAAAVLLGNMGPKAEVAMPTLLAILKNKKEPADLRKAVSRTIALLVGSGPVSRAGSPGGELQLASFTPRNRLSESLAGTWKRRLVVDGNDIQVTMALTGKHVTITADKMMEKGPPVTSGAAFEADYAVTKDGLLFGVMTSVRSTIQEKSQADALKRVLSENTPAPRMSALPPLKPEPVRVSAILDVPFSIHLRRDGDRVTIHNLRVGGCTAEDSTLKAVSNIIEGTYERCADGASSAHAHEPPRLPGGLTTERAW